MARLIGLDVGTSGCKAILVDESGLVLNRAERSYPLSTPKPGWSEQDPEDWWQAASACLAEVGRADAIGLTGQMHGAVFLDAVDRVIRPAILWNDQRTADACAWAEKACPEIREVTANPVLTGFQLPKLIWLRQHEPDNYARVRSLLLPKDYIRFRLTGEKVTEPSDASGTSLLNVAEQRWATDLFQRLGIDAVILPRIAGSSEVTGSIDGMPVVGGAGDCAAGAVGTGAVVPGVISVSLGTSGVVFEAGNTCVPDPTGATHSFCHATGKWHRMGVMLSCGGALRWFRDVMAPGCSYDEISGWASEVEAEGVTFKPYLAGERCPWNDPNLRGSFEGLSLAHDRRHLARAVFEGITSGILDCLQAIRGDSARDHSAELRVTGGGARSALWMQLLADRSGFRCVTLEADEGPALGGALLAGVGVGVWPDLSSACGATVRVSRQFEPKL